MRPTVIDGRSIDQFIPSHLREMFYNNPIPQYKYATHNGYDPYGFSTEGLVLYLPLWALKESSFKSVDAYKHTATITGTTPVWTPQGWSFPGVNEVITIPASASIDNMVDVTYLQWVKHDTDRGELAPFLFSKGDGVPPNNFFYVLDTGRFGEITFSRSYATTNAHARSTDLLSVNEWNLVAATAISKVPKIYINATEVAYEQQDTGDGALVDDSGFDMKLGNSLATDRTLNGVIGESLVYNRGLSVAEIGDYYNRTAWRYQ